MNFAINFAASTSACLLAVQVSEVLARRLRRAPPTVKQIQDVVEQALISANPPKTARAYIVTASSTRSCAGTATLWSTSRRRSTNISNIRIGESTPTPIRAIAWAA